MLADPRADALVDNFAGQWLLLRQLDERRAGDEGVRRQPALVVPARDRTAVRDDPPRGPQRRRSARCRLHVRRRAAGEALRHPEHPRQPLPARRAARRRAARAARSGQLPDRHVGGQPHVAGQARQVDSREPARRAGAAAAARRRDQLERRRRRRRRAPTSLRQRLERHRANPSCASCHAVMDPIGFALENFDLIGQWRDADGGAPVNAVGHARRRHRARRPGEPAAGAARSPRGVRRDADRKAANLRAGPAGRVLRHAGRPRHRPRARRATTTGSPRSSSASSRACRSR